MCSSNRNCGKRLEIKMEMSYNIQRRGCDNMKKDNVYKVEIKPKWEWNFSAKFYLVCIIIFVLLVAYIQIYRHIHREEIIQNALKRENEIVEENEVK